MHYTKHYTQRTFVIYQPKQFPSNNYLKNRKRKQNRSCNQNLCIVLLFLMSCPILQHHKIMLKNSFCNLIVRMEIQLWSCQCTYTRVDRLIITLSSEIPLNCVKSLSLSSLEGCGGGKWSFLVLIYIYLLLSSENK